jgi:hypothetical protein
LLIKEKFDIFDCSSVNLSVTSASVHQSEFFQIWKRCLRSVFHLSVGRVKTLGIFFSSSSSSSQPLAQDFRLRLSLPLPSATAADLAIQNNNINPPILRSAFGCFVIGNGLKTAVA